MIGLALFHLVHHLRVLQIDPTPPKTSPGEVPWTGVSEGDGPPLRLLFAGVDDRRDPVAGEVVQLPILHPRLQYVRRQCRTRASVLALRPFQLGQRSCLLGTPGGAAQLRPRHTPPGAGAVRPFVRAKTRIAGCHRKATENARGFTNNSRHVARVSDRVRTRLARRTSRARVCAHEEQYRIPTKGGFDGEII